MMGCFAALSLADCGSSGGGSGSGSGGSSDSGGDPSWASDSLLIEGTGGVRIEESGGSYYLGLLSSRTCWINDYKSGASFQGEWSAQPTGKGKFEIAISGLGSSVTDTKCTCTIKVAPQIKLTIPADQWDAYREGKEVPATLELPPFSHAEEGCTFYPNGVGTSVKVETLLRG